MIIDEDNNPKVEFVYRCKECPLCAYARDRCGNVVRECEHTYGIDLKWDEDLDKIPDKCPLRRGPFTIQLCGEVKL